MYKTASDPETNTTINLQEEGQPVFNNASDAIIGILFSFLHAFYDYVIEDLLKTIRDVWSEEQIFLVPFYLLWNESSLESFLLIQVWTLIRTHLEYNAVLLGAVYDTHFIEVHLLLVEEDKTTLYVCITYSSIGNHTSFGDHICPFSVLIPLHIKTYKAS